MPFSIVFFVATGVVFFFQSLPMIGMVMMLMLAPFWSVLLINLGFIGIGAEALIGRVAMVWILAPVIWFGGYAVAAWRSHADVALIEAEVRAANATLPLAFNAAHDRLLMDPADWRMQGVAASIIRYYELDHAFESLPENSGLAYRAHRVGNEAQCRELRAKLGGVHNPHIQVSDYSDGTKTSKALCAYYTPGEPEMPVHRVIMTATQADRRTMPVDSVEIAVHAPDGHTVRRISVVAHPLTWFPQPVIGCGLDASTASWPCFARFWRDDVTIGTPIHIGGTANHLVAQAIGLKRATLEARLASLQSAQAPKIHTVFADSEQTALKKLDEMLRGEGRHYQIADVEPLRRKPDLLRDRAQDMADYYIANNNRRDTGRVIPNALEHSFEFLAERDFRGIAPRLAEALHLRPGDNCHDSAVVARLGLIGAPAMPALEAQARNAGPRYCYALLQSLCRAGTAAIGLADGIANTLRQTAPNSNGHLHFMAHRALLRMNRRDLAENANAPGNRSKQAQYDHQRATISSVSPADVCD